MNMIAHRFAALAAAVLLAVPAAHAADVDRYLSIVITVDGHQNWRNVLQWSKATTTQRYEFGTGLRSDGKLWGANINDLDLERRLVIKTEYLRQKGMSTIRANGFDPNSPTLAQDLTNRAQKDSFGCKGEPVCISEVGAKYAAMMAAAVEPPNPNALGGDPRYQIFTGFKGCPNKIHNTQKSETTGETAWGRKKDHIYPYALKTTADYTGSETDKQSMCTFFNIVIDTAEQQMYVDNVYVPSARGRILRTEFEKTTDTEGDLPVPPAVLEWVGATLRKAPMTGKADTTVPLTLPLDGNSTVLGAFEGSAKVHLEWSFTLPAAGLVK
ncbi:MAG TPA: hypothetical protein VJM11_21100 [Nevskiaceae bacterium]|nr:hypothetical protein [Nevskiaceae bacterium]